MSSHRDVFPLRFKDARVRDGLKSLAEQSGTPMTVIAKAAIAHEIVLQGADLERRLEAALAVARSYRPEQDLDSYIDAAALGEVSGLDPFSRVTQEGASSSADRRRPAFEADDPFRRGQTVRPDAD